MQKINIKVENFRRFLYRTENFLADESDDKIHPDTLKYYVLTLEKQLDPIKSDQLTDDDQLLLFQNRIRFCQQLLRNKLDQATHSPTKISRTADLKARQLLLRGNAQREARQREELLKAKEIQVQPKEKKLTLRQRRLLLLEEDDQQQQNSTLSGEKEADEMANHTLTLVQQLKQMAKSTGEVVKDDNKLLEVMDEQMEKNLGNLITATKKVEEQLKSGGGVQWFMLFVVFIVWCFMIVMISTVPKLNF